MCTGTHAFIPAANTARVRMIYQALGQKVMNVFYWKKTSPWTAEDCASFATEVKTAWEAEVQPNMPAGVTLLTIEVVGQDEESGPGSELSVNEAGAGSAVLVPLNVTFTIKFITGLTGRSFRGRMYYIGIVEGDLNGNDILTASANTYLDNYRAFFAAIESATSFTHVVVSYCNDGAWRASAVVTPVTGYVYTDTHFDSQRRRLTGRGQ